MFFHLYFKRISTKLVHHEMTFTVNTKYLYLEDIICMYFHQNKYYLSLFFPVHTPR